MSAHRPPTARSQRSSTSNPQEGGRPAWGSRLLTRVLCAALLLGLATTATAGEPQVTKRSWVFTFSWYPHNKVSSMRGGMVLSPDGARVLFARRHARKQADGSELDSWSLALRSIDDRKDVDIPVPHLESERLLSSWLNGRVFDPSGDRIVLPLREGKRHRVAIYDVKTRKVRKLATVAATVVPAFDATGKTLIVTTREAGEKPEIRFLEGAETPAVAGAAGPANPKAPILPIVTAVRTADVPAGALVLYNTAKRTTIAVVATDLGDRLVQARWTEDGRYLYWGIEGKTRAPSTTGVWDRTVSRQIATIPGAVPIGTGPDSGSMVLVTKRQPYGELIHLHDAALGKQWTVSSAFPNAITAHRGRVLDIDRLDEDEFDITLFAIAPAEQ